MLTLTTALSCAQCILGAITTAPPSIFLSQAIMSDSHLRHDLLLDMCCMRDGHTTTPILKTLHERCKQGDYKTLMQLMYTVVRSGDDTRRPLLVHINSYHQQLLHVIDNLRASVDEAVRRVTESIRERDKAGFYAHKKPQQQQQLGTVGFQGYNPDKLYIDAAASLLQGKPNKEQFVRDTLQLDKLTKQVDTFTVEKYGYDDGVESVFARLGLLLELHKVMAETVPGSFLSDTTDRTKYCLQGFENAVKDLLALYKYMYFELRSDAFEVIVGKCKQIHDDVRERVHKAKELTEKLECISKGEKSIIKAIQEQGPAEIYDVNFEELLKTFTDSYNKMHMVNSKNTQFTDIQSQRDEISNSIKHDTVNVAKQVVESMTGKEKMSLSMLTLVSLRDQLVHLHTTQLLPLDLTDSPSLLPDTIKNAPPEIKSSVQTAAESRLKGVECDGAVPAILLPQAIYLAERQAWLKASSHKLTHDSLDHRQRWQLYALYGQLSGHPSSAAVNPPKYALYKYNNNNNKQALLKASSVYRAVVAVLRRNKCTSDDDIMAILAEDGWMTPKLKRIHSIIVSLRNQQSQNDDIIGALEGIIKACDDKMTNNTVIVQSVQCVTYQTAVRILKDTDKAAIDIITTIRSSGNAVQELVKELRSVSVEDVKEAIFVVKPVKRSSVVNVKVVVSVIVGIVLAIIVMVAMYMADTTNSSSSTNSSSTTTATATATTAATSDNVK